MGKGWLWLLLLAGCTPAVSSPEQAMGRWLGKDISLVVASWGTPAIMAEGPGDGRTYVYPASHYSRRYYPANLVQPGPLPYSSEEERECRGVLETDAAGIVVRAQWVGYECPGR